MTKEQKQKRAIDKLIQNSEVVISEEFLAEFKTWMNPPEELDETEEN